MKQENSRLAESFIARGLKTLSKQRFNELKFLEKVGAGPIDQARALLEAMRTRDVADAMEPSSYLTEEENDSYLEIKKGLLERKTKIDKDFRGLWVQRQQFEDLIIVRKSKNE